MTHQAEAFLLEMLSAGYTIEEMESGFRAAPRPLARRSTAEPPAGRPARSSASPEVTTRPFRCWPPALPSCAGCTLHLSYTGSLGGLIALAEGKADIAGSHLWDEESDTYNAPFVRRLLPGRTVALLTLAHRRLGLMVATRGWRSLHRACSISRCPGRASSTGSAARARGCGWTRSCAGQACPTGSIDGYDHEVTTHEAVARAVAEGAATTGLGIETAARDVRARLRACHHGDLRSRHSCWQSWDTAPVQALVGWLRSEAGRSEIASLGGYDLSDTGNVTWVE